MLGVSVVLPWRYWLARCSDSIVIGWAAGWWSAVVLIGGLQPLIGYADRTRDTANAVALSLAALGGLVTNYRLRLCKRFGWSSLDSDDRSGFVIGCALMAITLYDPVRTVVEPLQRAAVCALAVAVIAALTLNVVGGARWAVRHFGEQVSLLQEQLPAGRARMLRSLADPALSAYWRASTSVLVGVSIVAFVVAIAPLDLRGALGQVVTIGGTVVIVVTPILFHRQSSRKR